MLTSGSNTTFTFVGVYKIGVGLRVVTYLDYPSIDDSSEVTSVGSLDDGVQLKQNTATATYNLRLNATNHDTYGVCIFTTKSPLDRTCAIIATIGSHLIVTSSVSSASYRDNLSELRFPVFFCHTCSLRLFSSTFPHRQPLVLVEPLRRPLLAPPRHPLVLLAPPHHPLLLADPPQQPLLAPPRHSLILLAPPHHPLLLADPPQQPLLAPPCPTSTSPHSPSSTSSSPPTRRPTSTAPPCPSLPHLDFPSFS